MTSFRMPYNTSEFKRPGVSKILHQTKNMRRPSAICISIHHTVYVAALVF